MNRVYIIGGGPSIKYQDLSYLKHENVIGVNKAFFLDYVDVCWFGDWEFFTMYRRTLIGSDTPLYTCCPKVCKLNHPKITCYPRSREKQFGITTEPNKVCWNLNSGASAINFAYHLGYRQIVLLGFDMRLYDGDTHFHDGYKKSAESVETNLENYLVCFQYIKQDADELGLEIINASPISRIDCFKTEVCDGIKNT